MRIGSHAEFLKLVRGGATFGRLAATVIDRQERRTRTGTRMGIVNLSDRSGQFEVVIFSERLAQFRDLLEPGKVVVVTVSASIENEDARLIVQAVEDLDQAVARGLKGLKVFVRDEQPLPSLQARLGRKGEGDIYVVVMAEGEDVEIRLPGRYDVSPAMVGALKSVAGVLAVSPSDQPSASSGFARTARCKALSSLRISENARRRRAARSRPAARAAHRRPPDRASGRLHARQASVRDEGVRCATGPRRPHRPPGGDRTGRSGEGARLRNGASSNAAVDARGRGEPSSGREMGRCAVG